MDRWFELWQAAHANILNYSFKVPADYFFNFSVKLCINMIQTNSFCHWTLHWLTTAVTHTRAKLLNPVALGEEICNLFGTRQRCFQVGMKHGVAEEQNGCVFRFLAFACTHTPPSFRSHYKQQGLGASFIRTGRIGLEWLPGHIPVCCRMSSMGLWHFTRLHARTTHPSKHTYAHIQGF